MDKCHYRLTTCAINELLNDYQLEDIVHCYLKRTHQKIYIVMNETGYMCSGFLLLSEAIDYIISKVKIFIEHNREEYDSFYYYNDNDDKVLISDETAFEQHIIDNLCSWNGGINTFTTCIVEYYAN